MIYDEGFLKAITVGSVRHIAELAERLQSDKIDWLSKFSLAHIIKMSEEQPGLCESIRIKFHDIKAAWSAYGLDSTGRCEMTKNGIFCASTRGGDTIGGLFCCDRKQGDPYKRLQDILDDQNVISVNVAN